MSRISDNVLSPGSQLGLHPDRYQEVIGLHGGVDLCAFNGINRPTDRHNNQCLEIVTQSQRDQLAVYLMQAELKREVMLGYFLGEKWTLGEELKHYTSNPFTLEHKHLLYMGYPTLTSISAGVVLDWGTPPFNAANEPNDPVQITVTTDVPTNEIVATYPNETVRIYHSRIVDNGDGTVTLSIPRCRCVKPEYNGDWDDPPLYYDDDVFLATVDVHRYWANEALGAQYVWRQGRSTTDCDEVCAQACVQVTGPRSHRLSIIHAWPATYASGVWTRTGGWCQNLPPDLLRVNYLSGVLNMSDEIYTARLAHTLMPTPPCSCSIVKQRWLEDRKVNQRGTTPYGSMQGAIDTWLADSNVRIGWGGIF